MILMEMRNADGAAGSGEGGGEKESNGDRILLPGKNRKKYKNKINIIIIINNNKNSITPFFFLPLMVRSGLSSRSPPPRSLRSHPFRLTLFSFHLL